MLHTDQNRWSTPEGGYEVPNPSGGLLHDLAREIEDTQRRQSDTIAHIVERMRAVREGRLPEEPVAPRRRAELAEASDEPWDNATAEALMRSYESDGESEGAGRSHAQQPFHVAGSGSNNEWFGERITDVTQRIKRTLSDLKPGNTMMLLEERLDQFQRQMASALEDVLRRSDLDGLRVIEQHVNSLGEKFSELERHVARLDGIEADVRSVMDQVSDERISKLLDYDSRFAADLEAVALRAAEEVHARIGQAFERAPDAEAGRRHDELRALIEASIQDRRQAEAESASMVTGLSGRVSAQSDRYDDLKGLLEQAIQEQRQSEKTAVGMLDTLQQALVQVLDRMDGLEQQQPQHHAGAGWDAPALAAAAAPVPSAAPARIAIDEHAAHQWAPPVAQDLDPAQSSAFSGFGEIERMSPVEIPAAFDDSHGEPRDDAISPVDRMRRDFIADARRAKMKAAANRAEAVAEKPEPQKRGVIDPNRAALAQAARLQLGGSTGKLFGASPKLLAAALAVVVVINGGILLLNRKDTARTPAPEITVPADPQAKSGAGAEAPDAQSTETPEARPHTGLNDSGALDFGDAEPAAAPEANTEQPLLTPYGIQDDVLSPPAVEIDGKQEAKAPRGVTVAKTAGAMPNELVAGVYEQQVLASLSGKLGTIAAEQSPDALLPEKAGRIETAYTPPEATNDAVAEGKTSSALDLPPASVGPLSLRLAAANGDASAEFEVAARLAEGKGTGQNFAEALRWYQRSAAKGFAQAQYRLGTLYERGLGVTQDLARAKVWYGRAAEQGNVKSMHNLAVLSAGGEKDEPDFAGALKWFSKAADYGLADSQYNLGVLLENGLGTKADAVTAYKWYALAANGGDADAKARRDALKASFNAEQMKTAEVLASTFKPKATVALANDARAAGEDWKKRANTADTGK